MEAFLDQLHARVRSYSALHRLAVVSRILLAVGFIPPALVKIQGHRFTTAVDLTDPISAFFEAMYQTGGYWRFIGWVQLLAGACLLVPRLTTLGAVLFFPILVNIFVITIALRFTGTPLLVGLMLLANAYLLLWDFDRLKAVVWPPARSARTERMPAGVPAHWSHLERTGYALGTTAALGAFLLARGLVPRLLLVPFLVMGLLAAGMVVAAWARTLRSSASLRNR